MKFRTETVNPLNRMRLVSANRLANGQWQIFSSQGVGQRRACDQQTRSRGQRCWAEASESMQRSKRHESRYRGDACDEGNKQRTQAKLNVTQKGKDDDDICRAAAVGEEKGKKSWSWRRRKPRILEGSFSRLSGGRHAVETLGKAQPKKPGDGELSP